MPKGIKGFQSGELNPQYKHGKKVGDNVYRKKALKCCELKCQRCGKKKGRLEVHHKNEDHKDNRIENFEFLCRKCHAIVHLYKPVDKKKLEELYVNQKKLLSEITKIMGHNAKKLRAIIGDMGIKRSHSETNRIIWRRRIA